MWWQVTENSSAGRVTAQVVPAISQRCADATWKVATPRHQIGYVRMWNARAVDLRNIPFGQDVFQLPPHPAAPDTSDTAAMMGIDSEEATANSLALRLNLALQAPLEVMLRTEGPLTWPTPIFPFQKEGILTLLQSSQILLSDEMGLGKTVQVIAALRLLAHRHGMRRALVVAPAGLLEQWRRELQKWAPELRVIVIGGARKERRWQWRYHAHVTLVSYDTLRCDADGSAAWNPLRTVWSVVVLDEAQRIKNSETDTSIVCKKLPRHRSWALTGTPLENSPSDVASLLEFMTGKRHHGALLRPLLERYQLRRRKNEVLEELPPKITTTLRLALSPSQRRAYEQAEMEGIKTLRAAGGTHDIHVQNVLALITRLKQICNVDAASGASAKLADMRERLEEIVAAGHKAVVFSQYTDANFGVRRIASHLKAFAPLIYTGEMNPQQRDHVIDEFNADLDRKVLLLSLRAGGQGLNLQCASYVFHFDQWWNPATAQQAEDRAHRLGQIRHVHVYRYVMADTIEERIEKILLEKRHLFDQLIEGTTSQRIFSQRDLLELVGLNMQ